MIHLLVSFGPRLLFSVVSLLASAMLHAAPTIQHWQTVSGARVYLVEAHELPMLDVSVEFPAGSARDSREKSGVASMTLRLMRLGAEGWGEEELARRLADVGANLGQTFDLDRAGYSVRSLSSETHLNEALAVLTRILRAPEFPAEVLERERARVLAGIREADTKPESVAAREFLRLVYGEHPYALRSSGDAVSVSAIAREDLLAFHSRHFVAGEAVVAITGDVSRARAEAIAEQLTSGLPRAQAALPALPSVSELAQLVTRDIEHPSAQAHVLMGQPGLRRSDPDYFALWVGNYILGGGGFSSRFNEEVREKRGLSYSVYSYFSPLQQLGPFQIGLQTRKDQGQEALQVVRRTLEEFVANGPTQRELESAKQNIIGGFPLRIDSNRKMQDYLAMIGFYRLPLDYLEQFPQQVERVTVEQIRDAFRRRVHPERMATVVVGTVESKP